MLDQWIKKYKNVYKVVTRGSNFDFEIRSGILFGLEDLSGLILEVEDIDPFIDFLKAVKDHLTKECKERR